MTYLIRIIIFTAAMLLAGPSLAITQFVHNNRGLVTGITDPLLMDTIFTYDPAGRVATRTDRNGHLISFAYTPSGKTKTITYPDATSVGFTYDTAWENVAGMTDSLGTSSYVYDAANWLTSQTDANGFSVAYDYDAAGNVISLTYPGNKTLIYNYDALNRLETVSDWLGQTATYIYDTAGRLTDLIHFNGSVTQYTYDNADRLTDMVNRRVDSSIISSHNFSLDANGNRTQEVRDTPAVSSNWFDENVSFTYNAIANRLLNTDTDSFSYDDEGQQVQKNIMPFTWDYEHRLITIGADNQFYYDGVGNRLQASRSGITTQYIYDASGNLLAEADAIGTITRYYVHGQGLLAAITPAGESYSYHFDGTGHTVAMTDASETVVNSYSYSPYGRLVDQQETITQPFKYVGQYGVMTEPDGLYYMRARYYDPAIGRFISEDPIGLEGGLNLYAYVGGNPVNAIDPSGEIGIWGSAAGALLGAGSSLLGSWATGGIGAFSSWETWAGAGTSAVIGGFSGFFGDVTAGVRATILRGAALNVGTNAIGQTAGLMTDGNPNNNWNYNYGALAGSAIGGGWAAGITRGAGPLSSAIAGWGPSTASTAVGTALGKRF